MNRLTLPAGTLETVEARVSVDGGATDPTSFEVEYALLDPDAAPTEMDWSAGTWAPAGPPYLARALVSEAAGEYRLWFRITGDGEIVIRDAAIIEFA